MYSGHNFYFKPPIASLALLPVVDRKGIEARGFIKRKASIQHGPHHPSIDVADITNAERHCQVNGILFSGIRVCALPQTIVDHSISIQSTPPSVSARYLRGDHKCKFRPHHCCHALSQHLLCFVSPCQQVPVD